MKEAFCLWNIQYDSSQLASDKVSFHISTVKCVNVLLWVETPTVFLKLYKNHYWGLDQKL